MHELKLAIERLLALALLAEERLVGPDETLIPQFVEIH